MFKCRFQIFSSQAFVQRAPASNFRRASVNLAVNISSTYYIIENLQCEIPRRWDIEYVVALNTVTTPLRMLGKRLQIAVCHSCRSIALNFEVISI